MGTHTPEELNGETVLSASAKYAKELVNGQQVVSAHRVKTNKGNTYYAMQVGKHLLKCTPEMYHIHPIKSVLYRNE